MPQAPAGPVSYLFHVDEFDNGRKKNQPPVYFRNVKLNANVYGYTPRPPINRQLVIAAHVVGSDDYSDAQKGWAASALALGRGPLGHVPALVHQRWTAAFTPAEQQRLQTMHIPHRTRPRATADSTGARLTDNAIQFPDAPLDVTPATFRQHYDDQEDQDQEGLYGEGEIVVRGTNIPLDHEPAAPVRGGRGRGGGGPRGVGSRGGNLSRRVHRAGVVAPAATPIAPAPAVAGQPGYFTNLLNQPLVPGAGAVAPGGAAAGLNAQAADPFPLPPAQPGRELEAGDYVQYNAMVGPSPWMPSNPAMIIGRDPQNYGMWQVEVAGDDTVYTVRGDSLILEDDFGNMLDDFQQDQGGQAPVPQARVPVAAMPTAPAAAPLPQIRYTIGTGNEDSDAGSMGGDEDSGGWNAADVDMDLRTPPLSPVNPPVQPHIQVPALPALPPPIQPVVPPAAPAPPVAPSSASARTLRRRRQRGQMRLATKQVVPGALAPVPRLPPPRAPPAPSVVFNREVFGNLPNEDSYEDPDDNDDYDEDLAIYHNRRARNMGGDTMLQIGGMFPEPVRGGRAQPGPLVPDLLPPLPPAVRRASPPRGPSRFQDRRTLKRAKRKATVQSRRV